MQNGKEKIVKNLNVENLLYLNKQGYSIKEISEFFGATDQELYRIRSSVKNGRVEATVSGTGLGLVLNQFKTFVEKRRSEVRRGRKKGLRNSTASSKTQTATTDFLNLPDIGGIFYKDTKGQVYKLVAQPLV